MSIFIMSNVWRDGPEDRAQLLVMLALADFADDDGECWPAMATIAKKARMTERSARRTIRDLEQAGYITTKEGGGRHGCNVYRIGNTDTVSPGQNAPPGQDVPETRTPVSAKPSITTIKKEERAKRLPEQWEPSAEGFHFGLSEGLSAQDVWREADKFRDYWTGKAGKDGAKLNWESTWRNWIRKAADDRKPKTRGNQPADDPTLRAIARAAGAFEASPVDWPSGRGAA